MVKELEGGEGKMEGNEGIGGLRRNWRVVKELEGCVGKIEGGVGKNRGW